MSMPYHGKSTIPEPNEFPAYKGWNGQDPR